MKLAVLGGCGVRSIFLAKSISQKSSLLDITDVVFMDIDPERIDVYGSLSASIFKKLAPHVKFTLTIDVNEALQEADYVITTIRAGGDLMRAQDERIALDLGVLGQETVGAAGFSFAMRNIPVLVNYCKKIKTLSKSACKVFNFTNPAGLVTQAMYDAGFDFTYGICDAPSGMLKNFSKLLKTTVSGYCYGLNHLSFFNEIYADNINITDKILTTSTILENSDLKYFPKEFFKRNKFIPNEYLYYYYYPDLALANILKCGKSRGEHILELNKKMTSELKNLNAQGDLDKAIPVFSKWYGQREDAYMAGETGIKRSNKWAFVVDSDSDGGYADVALKYIELQNKKNGGEMILCVPNKNQAIDELDCSDVIEITCNVLGSECIPQKVLNIPPVNMQLIKQVKLYERLASKAILDNDFDSAVDALYVNPMVGSYNLAEKLATSYFKHNSEYLIQKRDNG
jgi:6-phospho-beta-glucosidase